MTQLIGVALGNDLDPISHAQKVGADCVQIQVGDPQGWGKPSVAYTAGAAALKADLKAAGIKLYVHSAYVINVASTNNRIRIPSRKLLQSTVDFAHELGAAGVVVHGGHVTKEDDPAQGFENWKKCVDQLDFKVPLLIENTAGGSNAMARTKENLVNLWAAVGESEAGFCLDTCHAWAGGWQMETLVADVLAITKRVDLIHANGSRDTAGSGRDRHDNFESSLLDKELILKTVKESKADVVCETNLDLVHKDIQYLRSSL